MTNPPDGITNPGVSPTPATPGPDRDKPRLGEGEEAQQQKPFSLPPEPASRPAGAGAGVEETGRPSPMEAARSAEETKGKQIPPEELSDQINQLQTRLAEAKEKLQNPQISKNMTPDHETALNRLTEKMNPDMRTIAKNSDGEFNPPVKEKGQGPLQYITKWIDGSQGTLSNALDYLSKETTPNPGSYLKLQYAVQRATQRGELFASIIGSSVSGIKTIMSTQLG